VRDSVAPRLMSSYAAIAEILKSLITLGAASLYGRHRIAVVEFNFVWMHLLHSGACVVLGKSRQRRDHRYSGQGPAKCIAQQYLRLELEDMTTVSLAQSRAPMAFQGQQ